MHLAKNKLFNPGAFDARLAAAKSPISVYKDTIKNGLSLIEKHQGEGVSAADIVSRFTWMIDQLVCHVWQRNANEALVDQNDIALIAVGGYGRNELHPYSDVDLLILLKNNDYTVYQEHVENFLRFLWDIGLDVGHSVRSSKDCLKEAKQDITIMTNLLEARHLAGNDALLISLDKKLRASRIWSADKFFGGKMQEQNQRYQQSDDSAYRLEPNLKEGFGGLRDLQTILWVFNRRYGTRTFKQMNEHGFINDDEYRILIRARNILWKLRTGLHLITGRREDRLLFDSQRELAKVFGYEDNANHLAVEQLMKRYYRTIKDVLYLNEVLLSLYQTLNLKKLIGGTPKVLDKHFQITNKLIEIRKPDVFETHPPALLELFTLMQKNAGTIDGIHPDTIRSIRAHLDLINHQFRSNPECKALFIQLFCHDGVMLTNVLERMNAYGVLGAYLPAFGSVVGQMQHDLFHVYTVDGHTLKVIENLIRLKKQPQEYRIASDILFKLYKPERLVLSALFHDIAKGRGGDHSELGAVDAYEFCIDHQFSEYDAKFVGWLVEQHLIMSHFSQRKDISDPAVIQAFADIVGDLEHLDNLYLLTLADIRGTSPKVWNAWKGQLLIDLYQATRQVLRHDLAEPINVEEHIKDDKEAALTLLEGIDSNHAFIHEFWNTLPNDYFVRNEPYYIAWHAKSLSQAPVISLPVVSVRYSERLEANMFFVFAPESKRLLTQVTAAFDELELNIIDARIQSTSRGFALYSFNAIVPDSDYAQEASYMRHLEEQIRKLILEVEYEKIISRRSVSRALKHFPIKPKVNFSFANPNYTVMDVFAQDQPGLLHNVAILLRSNNVKLLSAKIATFGERAEDVFFIQNYDETQITSKSVLDTLASQICAALDKSPRNDLAQNA